VNASHVRTRREFMASLVFLAVLALLPLIVTSNYWLGIVIVAMYYSLLAIAWNLLAGYTGQFSLAPTAFAMLGAYGTGMASYHFGLPPAVGVPVAIVVSAGIGMALGRVVVPLRVPYLALTTIAFAEILRHVARNAHEYTRGDFGMPVPLITADRVGSFYLMLAVLVGVQVGLYFLLRSSAGLFLQAIRDDETAAAGRGINVIFWKTVAFSLSGAICGFAGAMYVHFSGLASPDMGHIFETGLVLAAVVIGGIGTMIGPLIGGFIVQFAAESFREFGLQHMLIFAAMVILIVRFFHEGLWGLIKRLWDGPRKRPAPAETETG
jgi:branched-chain amino acid transport system permease protein